MRCQKVLACDLAGAQSGGRKRPRRIVRRPSPARERAGGLSSVVPPPPSPVVGKSPPPTSLVPHPLRLDAGRPRPAPSPAPAPRCNSLSLSPLPHTRDKKSHGSDQPQYIIPLRIRTKWKVCGLLMPPSARKVYFALRTFNVKILSIKDSSHLVAIRAAARGRQSRFEDNNAFGDDSSSLATRL